MEKVDLKNKRSRTFRRVAAGKRPLRTKKSDFSVDNVSEEKKQTNDYKSGVSVIISAWNTAEYIEDCLDSVSNQTWFKNHENWEILLGIDACEKTLEKVKSIMNKYRNLAVFMMKKNVGTYVTCNTLAENAKYEWLLRFDSDDIMPNDMINKIFSHNLKDYGVVRYRFNNFGNKDGGGIAWGSHAVRHKTFKEYGGYRNWRISGDYDFLYRLEPDIKTTKLEDIYYNRRCRPNTLEFSEETNMKSDLRKQLNTFVKNESRKQAKINMTTTECYVINDNRKKIKCIISLTSWKARINTVYKTIETLKKNKGYKIVLCLSEKEFPKKEKELPKLLMEHVYNGDVELLWVYENYKAFKKFLFTIEKYRNLNIPIISADDDCLYKEGYADELYNKWLKNKNCVIRYNMYNEKDDWQFTQGPCTLYPPCVFDILLKIVKKLKSGELKIVKKDDNLITETLINNNIKIQHVHRGLNFCFTFHDEIKPIHNNRKNPKFKQCYEN